MVVIFLIIYCGCDVIRFCNISNGNMQEHKSFLIKDLLSDVLPIPQEGKSISIFFCNRIRFVLYVVIAASCFNLFYKELILTVTNFFQIIIQKLVLPLSH